VAEWGHFVQMQLHLLATWGSWFILWFSSGSGGVAEWGHFVLIQLHHLATWGSWFILWFSPPQPPKK